MAGIESQLFASGLPVAALMEKAGLGLAQRLKQEKHLKPRGVLVLVGPGHNGGDGLVVARELFLAGWPVRIWSPFSEHKPLCANHLNHGLWLGIPRLEQSPDPHGSELWIDALFGMGQTKPLPVEIAALFRQRQLAGGEVWSIDGPSGICCDQGLRLGDGAAHCQRSLVVGLWKVGLWQDSAMAWVGTQERIDLNLPKPLVAELRSKAVLGLWAKDCYGHSTPQPWPNPAAAKHGRGRLRVIAGSEKYPGAARLCLEGASASGLGWLEASSVPAINHTLAQLMPHVVWRRQEDQLERLDAVVVGPGIGTTTEIPADLLNFSGLVVLDADGINQLALSGNGMSWFKQRRGPTWITPHQAEFERLFPQLRALAPVQAALTAAEQTGAEVLIKGAHSCVATPQGNCYQLLETSPWAARAGMGDVLAGYAGGLGAMAMASLGKPGGELLALAALRHGNAGLELSRSGNGCANPLAVARQLANMK
jgi:NAD(P)H-hydrate epimerase